MAKSDAPTPAEPSKPEPVIHVSWSKDTKGGEIKVTGSSGLPLGQRIRVTLEGEVTGYSMNEYGCSIDVKGKKVDVADLGEGGAESMAETLTKGRAKVKKGYADS